MRANLLNEPNKKYTVRWKLIVSLILIIILITLMLFSYYQSRSRLVSLRNEVKNLDSQLSDILSRKEEYLKLQSKIEKIKDNGSYRSYYNWDKVIREQGYLVSENVMIDSLEIKSNKLFVDGIALNNEYFLEYLENTYESPYFKDVKINYIDQKDNLHFNLEVNIAEGG